MSNGKKSFISITIFTVLSFLIAWYMYNYYQEFLNFGIAVILMAIASGILWLIDKFILVGYDIIEELKDKNLAVAIALLAYAVLLGSCILSAFVIYK